MKEFWYKCPNCGFPKMLKYREDTRLYHFPGYCKKCRQEAVISLPQNIDKRHP